MADSGTATSIGEGLSGLRKYHEPPYERVLAETREYIGFATEKLGAHIPPGAKVLDYGCGLGQSVKALTDLGYNGHGVDIVEYWGSQFDQYWALGERPPPAVADRLHVIEQNTYRLPFPDHTFDFSFSQEVMEHVFDYPTAFSEICRVLKPDALSVHRFPGPGRLVEDHIFVPFPVLCRNRLYLAGWALAGRRSPIQQGLTWRETLRSNIETMRYCNYPTRRELRQLARTAGVEIAFFEQQELLFRSGGRLRNMLRNADRFGLQGVLLSALSPFMQRYMVLRNRQDPR
jgi:SAM-dependent methyltransferase